jgi:hypothetical protein
MEINNLLARRSLASLMIAAIQRDALIPFRDVELELRALPQEKKGVSFVRSSNCILGRENTWNVSGRIIFCLSSREQNTDKLKTW